MHRQHKKSVGQWGRSQWGPACRAAPCTFQRMMWRISVVGALLLSFVAAQPRTPLCFVPDSSNVGTPDTAWVNWVRDTTHLNCAAHDRAACSTAYASRDLTPVWAVGRSCLCPQVIVSAMPDVTGALNSSAPADVQRAEFIERFDPDVIDW
jgi:hypothetical protein